MTDRLRTPLCDLLGIDWPVLSAGFALGAAGADLAAAVSGAGGLGVIGATGMPDEFLRGECERTRALTDRPFGINLIVTEGTSHRSAIETATAAGASVAVLFWGDPAPYVGLGLTVVHQVGSVDEARAAAEAGVDAVIAQGVEAGGHVRGTTSIWELLPTVVAAVAPTPVLASGGIGDGEGIARALGLGAQGVSLGTRFVASDEANVHPEYKARIVASASADTVYTESLYDVGWPGAPHRTLRNRTYDEWHAAGRPASGDRPGEGTPIGVAHYGWSEPAPWVRYGSGVTTAAFDGDLDYAPLWAGESCSVVNDVKPAATIVRDLVREAAAALA